MGSTAILIIGIGLLILLNSLFACMEIALVSVPRARLKRFEKEGRPGAATAIALQKDIDYFFATVQVGVTFIGTLSSAIGGAAAVGIFTPVIRFFGVEPESTLGHVLAILGVSIFIAYTNLIIGELAPKSVARRYPGRISLKFAKPFGVFSRVFRPVVLFLTASTRLVLRIIGIRLSTKTPGLTSEELRMMATELVETHQMPVNVYDMLVRVTRLSQIRVEDVMIPRHKIIAVRAESKLDPKIREKALKVFNKYHFSNYPIVDKKLENVFGVINIKDFLYHDDKYSTANLIRPTNFTARGQTLDRALESMQRTNEQLSVVVDEHGTIDGIITLEDIVEELIGEAVAAMSDSAPVEPVKPTNGVITLDGLTTTHEFNAHHSIALPSSLYYSTLAGFMLDKLGKIPSPGDYLDFEGRRFEVTQMDRNRIKELRITPLTVIQAEPPDGPENASK